MFSSTKRALLVACVPLLVVMACSSGPSKVGDPCKPDGSACPEGSVCSPGGEGHICQVPMGGACDPASPDYCDGAAVCTAAALCELPVGAACDPAGQDHCEGAMVCGKNRDGSGTCGIAEGGTCDPADSKCAGGLTCAELAAGGYACHVPLLFKGKVFDSQSSVAVASAQVIALDAKATAVTDVAVTDATGEYVLEVPIARKPDGAPIPDVFFTLRASASGYQTFPGGLRTALPISSNEAQKKDDGWNVRTAITDVALISLPAEQKNLASVTGRVLAGEKSAGVLVVAEDAAGKAHSAITDRGGAYTIFNVPNGSYTVRGYAAGLQLTPATTTVEGAARAGVDLNVSSNPLGTVSGSLQLVNPGAGSATSVVLVVASTFSDTFVRGEVPRGLRTPLSGTPDVTGAFTIKDVPEGEYYVLAGFENDMLVRDPDPNISGTQIVKVKMASPGTPIALATSFKITGALPVVGPGANAPEAVSTAPTLTWGDDSSEAFYTVTVYNAYGERVWCRSSQDASCNGPNIPAVTGQPNVSVPYEGPLVPGMYFQFRATSWRNAGAKVGPVSNTEDLRGVFYVGSAP